MPVDALPLDQEGGGGGRQGGSIQLDGEMALLGGEMRLNGEMEVCTLCTLSAPSLHPTQTPRPLQSLYSYTFTPCAAPSAPKPCSAPARCALAPELLLLPTSCQARVSKYR